MPTPAVNVVRYTALLTGIFYGIVHRRTLQANFDHHAAEQELKKRERWLQEAKKAWAAKHSKSDGVVTDPDSPDFDLEKLLLSFDKQ